MFIFWMIMVLYWKEEGCLKGVFSYFSGKNYMKSLWERGGWVREKERGKRYRERERKRVRVRVREREFVLFVV